MTPPREVQKLKFLVYLDWDGTSALIPVDDQAHAERTLAEHVDDESTGFYIEIGVPDGTTFGWRWAQHIHATPDEGDET